MLLPRFAEPPQVQCLTLCTGRYIVATTRCRKLSPQADHGLTLALCRIGGAFLVCVGHEPRCEWLFHARLRWRFGLTASPAL